MTNCHQRHPAVECLVSRACSVDSLVTGLNQMNTQIYEGTNQVQRVVMARQLLKG